MADFPPPLRGAHSTFKLAAVRGRRAFPHKHPFPPQVSLFSDEKSGFLTTDGFADVRRLGYRAAWDSMPFRRPVTPRVVCAQTGCFVLPLLGGRPADFGQCVFKLMPKQLCTAKKKLRKHQQQVARRVCGSLNMITWLTTPLRGTRISASRMSRVRRAWA